MKNSDAQLSSDSAGIIIDGLNVAYWCGQPPSLRLPLTLMTHLLARRHAVQIYFDASAPHRLKDHDLALYELLRMHSQVSIEMPSGRRADGEMLRRARSSGARIVSRDRFRDYRSRFRRLIDDPRRIVSGVVESNVLRIPSLAIEAPLPSSNDEAWQQLCPFLIQVETGRRQD